jgi:hypothetical protein
MTAIDFPNSPTLNQTFSASGRTWIWDGSKWATSSGVQSPPIEHAQSHASGGDDSIEIAQSQVTNLVSDLSKKADSSDFTNSFLTMGA